jgi:phosphoglucomutase/phosphomannomutase
MTTTNNTIVQFDTAATTGKLSPAAVQNIRHWLEAPYLAEYAPLVAAHLAAGQWKELEDAFWTTIPFGTGGRRGRMYPIGCNAINERTIGESAQGLADYVKLQVAGEGLGGPARNPQQPLSCAIAYDTRHRSRQFAELCSEIMVAAGFTVYFLDGFRSTPELSFTVRYKHCDCGIMITASHNPPADNAVKVYGPSGGQFVPPHDDASIAAMQSVTWIHRASFAQAVADGKVIICQEEVDAAFTQAVLKQRVPGPRNLKILYSPLHGVGASAVLPVLAADGFSDVTVFGPHAEPNGDFPNVPKHVANPENPAVFDAMIDQAKQTGVELILATDPDSDRLGCAIPKSMAPGAPWATLTGNQLGTLLADFLLNARHSAGTLSSKNYVVKTLVTTEMIRRVADRYGAQTAGNLLVGFKWIGNEMDCRGPKDFIIGIEESYGFLAGDHVRDKDASVASLLTAELAAKLKAEGKTLYQRLDELYRLYGCFSESQVNVQMPGEKGMDDMKALMARVRTTPPTALGGQRVVRVRDYLNDVMFQPGGAQEPLQGPRGDMVILDLEVEGNYAAIRPSGTEPKVKIYLFACNPPATVTDLDATKAAQVERLKTMADDFKKYAGLSG